MKQKKMLFAALAAMVLWVIIGAVLVSCLLAMVSCSASPELDGDKPIEPEVVMIETPMVEPEPVSAPCYPSSVRFSNGYFEAVISDFAWGMTYQVQVRNFSKTCSFECCFAWSVFNGDTMLRTGKCCPFGMAPGQSKTVSVRIPWPWLNPPDCNLAVLKVRAE